MAYIEAEVDQLQEELASSISDVHADMPEIEGGFEIDLAEGVCGMSEASQDSKAEFCRREFGYLPSWFRGPVSLDSYPREW